MLKPLITSALSLAVLLAPLSVALTELQPHCFGHTIPLQLASHESGEHLHGVHHENCRWLKGGRQLVALPQSPPGDMLLAFSRNLPLQDSQSFSGLAYTDCSPRAPPLA